MLRYSMLISFRIPRIFPASFLRSLEEDVIQSLIEAEHSEQRRVHVARVVQSLYPLLQAQYILHFFDWRDKLSRYYGSSHGVELIRRSNQRRLREFITLNVLWCNNFTSLRGNKQTVSRLNISNSNSQLSMFFPLNLHVYPLSQSIPRHG